MTHLQSITIHLKKQLFCFFLFCSFPLLAQHSITGSVFDAIGKPISQATVVVKNIKTDQTIAFSYSGKDGNFSIPLEGKGTYILKISYLGLATYNKEITVNTNLLDLGNITLTESKVDLETVIIKSESSGMTEVGDTLKYRIEKFLNGTEESLKDVLNKLPGLDVDNEGKIKVNGKAVDKFLIDGQEFFIDQQKIATDNISAEMIKNIEIIKNYTEFKQLKKEQKSGLTAINVKIKDKFKNKITGNIALGVGQEKFNLHTNLFNFGKKIYSSLISDSNNTGELALTINDYMSFVNKKNDATNGEVTFSKNSDLPRFLTLGNNVKNRESYFTGLNFKYFPSKKMEVNLYSLFNTNYQTEEQIVEQEFYGANSNFFNTEKRNTQENSVFNITSLDASYKNTSNSLFTYKSIFSNFSKNNFVDLTTSNNKIDNENNAVDFNFNHNLEYSLILKRNKQLRIKAAQEVTNKSNDLNISANQPILNLNFPFNKYTIAQNTNYKKQVLLLNSNFDFYVKNHPFNIFNELVSKREQFESFEKQFLQFQNELILDNNSNTIGLTSKFELGLKNTLTTNLSYSAISLNTGTQEAKKQLFTPSFALKTSFSKQHYVKLSYALNNKLFGAENLIENQTIGDYRTIYSNNDVQFDAINKNNQFGLEYFYNNLKRNITVISNISYLEATNPITNNSFATQNSNLIQYKLAPYESFFNSFVFAEKQFKNFPFSLKGSASYAINNKNIFYENQKNELNTISYSGYFGIISRLKNKKLQFETGIQYSKDTYTDSFATNELTITKPYFNSSLQLSKSLSFTSNLSVMKYESISSSNTITFFSPRLRYSIPNSKIELSATGNNVFNIKNNEQITISSAANYNQQNRSQILAGYYLLSAKLKL